jgi:hypothetical protein
VLLSNHPQLAGGSHLPDITVITPVFSQGRVVFFVASRGHHADIGGISPGSMPPNSKLLVEEGAAVVSFKLVRDGEFQVTSTVAACCKCAVVWQQLHGSACDCAEAPTLPGKVVTAKVLATIHPHVQPQHQMQLTAGLASTAFFLPCCLSILFILQEAGITELLMAPGKLSDQLPGCSGTRNLSDNLSDLQAQVGRDGLASSTTVTGRLPAQFVLGAGTV